MSKKITASVYVGAFGVFGLPGGFFLIMLFGQQSFCWRNPDVDTNTMHNDVPCAYYDFPVWQGVVGSFGGFLVLASLAALLLAAVLFVMEVRRGLH